jgi:hypothetical protein
MLNEPSKGPWTTDKHGNVISADGTVLAICTRLDDGYLMANAPKLLIGLKIASDALREIANIILAGHPELGEALAVSNTLDAVIAGAEFRS